MQTFRKRARLLAPAALIALGLAACGGSDSSDPASPSASEGPVTTQQGGELTYGADQEPTGFNTMTSKDNGTAARNITIQVWPRTFTAQPDVTLKMNEDLLVSAELTNANPQTVVWKIRPEAVWSDGTPITAKDFIYTWENTNGSKAENDVATTTGYDAVATMVGSDNDKTVTATFKEVYPDWEGMFDHVMPAHVLSTVPGGWNTGFDNAPTISGGPYRIDSYEKGSSLKLVRNEKWYGKNKPNLDAIIFRFLPESQTQPDALRNNEVQMIYPQPQLDLVQQVKNVPSVKSEIGFGPTYEHFDFNFANPLLADPAVRRAIAQAINRQTIVDAGVKQFSDQASALGNRIFVSTQPAYKDNTPSDILKGDAAAAGKTLEEAGYTKGSDGIYAKGGQRLSFRFSTTSGNALRENQGVIFQKQMKDAGIDIVIANSPSRVLFPALSKGDFDISNFAWVGTPLPISSNVAIIKTGGDSNYGKYSSPVTDDLITRASQELDETKANDLANQADAQVWKDLATIPLYQKATFIAFYDKYAGIRDNATSDGPFYNSDVWGIRAQ